MVDFPFGRYGGRHGRLIRISQRETLRTPKQCNIVGLDGKAKAALDWVYS
jgi:hypothetical protein